jgi:ankyrin repeat protein
VVASPGGDGQTPLHFAGTIEVAEYLLAHGADCNALDVDHESTPAQYMVRDRQEIARLLVKAGCRTDLLLASALGDLELVRRHLDADPDCIRMNVSERFFPKRDPRSGGCIYIWTLGQYKTAHAVAREFGHAEVLRLLTERSPDELKLVQAAASGDEATAKALLAARPDLVASLAENDRRTLAHMAQHNDVRAVRLMLSVGWPVDVRGQHGATPLHWAAFHGNAEMVETLLRHGPPLESTDADFHGTPLGWATHGSEHGWCRATGDYVGCVERLLAAGAKLPEQIKGTEVVQAVLRRIAAGTK